MQDEEEKDTLLRACHKRCADRTLKAMEKNGGIFIKLGQHLVSVFLRCIFVDDKLTVA